MWDMFTACYLVSAEKMTLIDSGLPESWEQRILPYLRKLGRVPEDIFLVLHTHRDLDHVGSDRAVRTATKARIAVHELGGRDLANPQEARERYLAKFGKYLTERDLDNLRKRPLDEPLPEPAHPQLLQGG